MENHPSPPSKHWSENILVKAIVIGILILVLMIPSFMIQGLVRERASRKQEVITEISSKWGDLQTLTGPYIQIPYYEQVMVNNQPSVQQQSLYFFPTQLNTTADLQPVIKKRSIFSAVLYDATINMEGSFELPDLKALNIHPDRLIWEKATLHLAIADLSGIGSQINFKVGDNSIPMSAAAPAGLNLPSGLMGHVQSLDSLSKQIPFSTSIQLKGSQAIYFSPVARQNDFTITSTWSSPKFEGEFLPDESAISSEGFTASWKVLDVNRQIAQQWTSMNPQSMQNVTTYRYAYGYAEPATGSGMTPVLGVELIDTVDHYTKNDRTVKYAFLLITLTFVVYFFCEVLKKQKVHSLQYGLVGAALVIFFILLLSLSEQVGFDLAYMISSLATITLISLYSSSIFTDRKYAFLVGLLLLLQFGFIYVILQLEDFALLVGSITLFAILALIMYLTRNVKWQA